MTALVGALDVPQGAPVAEVEVRDAADEVIGTAELVAGRDTMEWAWDLPAVRPYVKHDRVEGAGLVLDNGPAPRQRQLSFAQFTFGQPLEGATSITVRAIPPVGEFVLYGAAMVGGNGSSVVQQLFGRTKAKYQQVYADDEITAQFDKDGADLLKKGVKDIRLEPGAYGLHVKGRGFDFHTDKLILTRGDVVALLNDDAVAGPEWLASAVAVLTDPGVAAVGPKILFPWPFAEINPAVPTAWPCGRRSRRRAACRHG